MKPHVSRDVNNIDPRFDQIIDGLYRVSLKAIIVRDHQLLMSHEPEGWYSLPGGGMKHGSTVEETFQREIHEELGIPPQSVKVDPQVVTANFGFILYGVPRANLYYRVNLVDVDEIPDGELGHLWATKDDLDNLQLSPATATLIDLLKSLL